MTTEKSLWNVVKGLIRKKESNLKHQGMVKCKYCGSEDVVKFGTYHGNQRWWCKECKRKFIDTDTIFKMKTPIRQISSALSAYYGGMSLDNIGMHLEQHYNNPVTDAGVYNWVKRFTKEAVDKAREYPPNVGDVWIADETALNIGGSHKVWFWDIMDAKTRFLLASHISTKRTTQDALLLMKLAEAHCLYTWSQRKMRA